MITIISIALTLLLSGNAFGETLWLDRDYDGGHRTLYDTTIVVIADGVKVKNVTLQNPVAEEGYGVVHVTANNVEISGVTINNGKAYHGIYLRGSGNKATGNVLNGGEYRNAGISVANPSDGVIVEWNKCNRVNMTGSIKGDGHCMGTGGEVEVSRPVKNVRMANNTIQYSGGTITNYQICIYNSENVQVLNNRIMWNYSPAIDIGTNSKNVVVDGNLIFANTVNRNIDFPTGMIMVDQSSGGCPECDTLDGVSVTNNYIAYNRGAKASIYAAKIETQFMRSVMIEGNRIDHNQMPDYFITPTITEGIEVH